MLFGQLFWTHWPHFLAVFLQKSGMLQPTWEREMERWGRVYSFSALWSFLLQSSDQRWVSWSALPVLDGSLPGFPQTVPLCLGKHEREMMVFKVPWQASDALGPGVFISASAAGTTASTHCLSAHVSAPALPDAKWAMKRCFIGQCSADLRDHHNNTLHSTLQCHLKGCIDGLVISSAGSVSTHSGARTDKKTGCKSLTLAESLEEQLADKSIRSMCQCALISNRPYYKDNNRMFIIIEPRWNAFMPRCQGK